MECKWGYAKIKKPTAFLSTYPDAAYGIVNQQNYLDWVAYKPE
ncbi:MAG: hypothetical protein QM610_05500 [Chitinophagaceae bacterium]